MLSTKEFAYKNHPDVGDIPAYVHYSKDLEGKDFGDGKGRPIVIIFHAGGFIGGSTKIIPRSEIETLADEYAFLVVCPEYRLCVPTSLHDGPWEDAKSVYHWTRETLPGLLEKEAGVKANGEKIVLMGQSAGGALSLMLGAENPPPSAILELYGMKYYTDAHWSSRWPPLESVPNVELEIPEPAYTSPPMFTLPPEQKPNMDTARTRYLIMSLKHGQLIPKIVRDGNNERVEPTARFDGSAAKVDGSGRLIFPPTFFIHGTADTSVPVRLGEKAHQTLREKGIETELALAQGKDHLFDLALQPQDKVFKETLDKGFEFLKKHVDL